MWLIGLYRTYLSRLKPYPTCRFTPTCSAYAYEAFEKRGFFAGFILMCWRLLRCSPLSPGGYDPVPQSGFRTMPLRWSRYDRYIQENRTALDAEDTAPSIPTGDDGQAVPEQPPNETSRSETEEPCPPDGSVQE